MSSKDIIKNYAILASESYRYYNNRVDNEVPSLIDDSVYYLVPTMSDKKSVLYVNNLKKEIVLSIRGTQNFSDIVTDVSVWENELDKTSHYKTIEDKLISVINEKKQLGYRLVLTGHSLGGSLILDLAKKFISDIDDMYLFNVGYGINQAIHNLTLSIGCKFLSKNNKTCKTERDIREKLNMYSSGDPLSMLSLSYGGTYITPRRWNVHTLKNYIGSGYSNEFIEELMWME